MGGARTALFNFLFARNQGGQLILRIEDTDQGRHREDSLFPLLQGLQWLKISWDEGPFLEAAPDAARQKLSEKGAFGPYRQKNRLSIYRREARRLLESGRAYYCFLTEGEEAAQKAKAIAGGRAYIPSSPYRDLSLGEAEKKLSQGEKACIRFRCDERASGGRQHFPIQDIVRGEVRFPMDSVGDFVLIRSEGFPVYNFSCAVDDSLMEISHVFRGEEHLANTLRQRLIQEALSLPPPAAGHLSLILGRDKKKLSKRKDSESLESFESDGFLPEAAANFLALLGWNPGRDPEGAEREVFSLEELIQAFSAERLNQASAVFDKDKFLWLNGRHIKRLSEEDLWQRLLPFLKRRSLAWSRPWPQTKKIIQALRSGFKTLKGAAELLRPFSDQEFSLRESALPVLKWPSGKKAVESWRRRLLALSPKDFLSLEDFQRIQKGLQKEDGLRGRELFMPLRCAILGEPQGVEIKLLACLLKRGELIRRADMALKAA